YPMRWPTSMALRMRRCFLEALLSAFSLLLLGGGVSKVRSRRRTCSLASSFFCRRGTTLEEEEVSSRTHTPLFFVQFPPCWYCGTTKGCRNFSSHEISYVFFLKSTDRRMFGFSSVSLLYSKPARVRAT